MNLTKTGAVIGGVGIFLAGTAIIVGILFLKRATPDKYVSDVVVQINESKHSVVQWPAWVTVIRRGDVTWIPESPVETIPIALDASMPSAQVMHYENGKMSVALIGEVVRGRYAGGKIFLSYSPQWETRLIVKDGIVYVLPLASGIMPTNFSDIMRELAISYEKEVWLGHNNEWSEEFGTRPTGWGAGLASKETIERGGVVIDEKTVFEELWIPSAYTTFVDNRPVTLSSGYPHNFGLELRGSNLTQRTRVVNSLHGELVVGQENTITRNLPDGTVIIYKYEGRPEFFPDPDYPDWAAIMWHSGQAGIKESYFAYYDPCTAFPVVMDPDQKSQLTVVGLDSGGHSVYAPSSVDAPIFQSIFDQGLLREYLRGHGLTEAAFLATHPLIAWDDPFGRTMVFVNGGQIPVYAENSELPKKSLKVRSFDQCGAFWQEHPEFAPPD